MPTRRIYVPEDGGEGCWLSKPWEPPKPWAEAREWWKCGRCGQGNRREDHPWQCKFCGTIRDSGKYDDE